MSNTYNATGLYNSDGSVTFYGDTGGVGTPKDYAKQEELSNLVLTGTTNTSGATIASGTCFVLNGDFVTAKADIASGATFTLNTNYEKKSVGSILTELNSNKLITNVFKQTSADNANDFELLSSYFCNKNVTNTPDSTYYWFILTMPAYQNYYYQLAFCANAPQAISVQYRTNFNGAWSSWLPVNH